MIAMGNARIATARVAAAVAMGIAPPARVPPLPVIHPVVPMIVLPKAAATPAPIPAMPLVALAAILAHVPAAATAMVLGHRHRLPLHHLLRGYISMHLFPLTISMEWPLVTMNTLPSGFTHLVRQAT